MTVTIEKVVREMGEPLIDRWRAEARRKYHVKRPADLSKREYVNMYIRHKYDEHVEAKILNYRGGE